MLQVHLTASAEEPKNREIETLSAIFIPFLELTLLAFLSPQSPNSWVKSDTFQHLVRGQTLDLQF